jgi:DNA processing protein
MNEDIRTRIALSLVPNIGAHRARILLGRVERPADVFKLRENDLLQIHGIGEQVVKHLTSFNQWSEVDRILRRTESLECRLIIPEQEDIYPRLLTEITDPPLLLWVRGDVHLLRSAGIAVVGTRSPSPYGKDMAALFTRDLVRRGMTIISGLAYGIDTIAHRTCVQEGGRTIAVLGSGIDRIYPTSNIELAQRILEKGGGIVSEFPPGTKPDYMNFPIRNRVVSGLSLGVLVVETGSTGGSMITARLALDQCREVFVVPHNLTNTRANGSLKLIRESSGKLVESIDDIISEFPWLELTDDTQHAVPSLPEEPAGLSDLAKICWSVLSTKSQVHPDTICTLTKLHSDQVLTGLTELEFTGMVRQRPGKLFEIVVN